MADFGLKIGLEGEKEFRCIARNRTNHRECDTGHH